LRSRLLGDRHENLNECGDKEAEISPTEIDWILSGV
jgi:hypothetical protein